ncbi:MAG: tetratricopeptide repeat protein [Ectothiorhodospiraceae bacterium]|nr:tetratricopeptide repeat protein [Ectothiorhodospiraceae bacterium]
MAAYSDDEQIEKLKEWFRENGKALVAGVIIAVGGVVGWQQWNAYQDRQAEAASVAYAQLLEARQTDADTDTVNRRGRTVMDDFPRTAYAAMAGLQLGEYHAARGELDQAIPALQWVVDNAGDSAFRHMARLRLSQVLVAAERADEAVSLLQVSDQGAFRVQYQERLGDAYAALGRHDDAMAAYEAVLGSQELGRERREHVELKRNDLKRGGNA